MPGEVSSRKFFPHFNTPNCVNRIGIFQSEDAPPGGTSVRVGLLHTVGLVLHTVGLVFHTVGLVLYTAGLVFHTVGLVLHTVGLVIHTVGLVLGVGIIRPSPSNYIIWKSVD